MIFEKQRKVGKPEGKKEGNRKRIKDLMKSNRCGSVLHKTIGKEGKKKSKEEMKSCQTGIIELKQGKQLQRIAQN